MFKIIKDGATLGYAASPHYVELLENGCFGLTDEAHAAGIAYEGTAYSLAGRAGLEGKEDVLLVEVDAGTVLNEQAATIATLTDELTSAQLALCDVYEAQYAAVGGDTVG